MDASIFRGHLNFLYKTSNQKILSWFWLLYIRISLIHQSIKVGKNRLKWVFLDLQPRDHILETSKCCWSFRNVQFELRYVQFGPLVIAKSQKTKTSKWTFFQH